MSRTMTDRLGKAAFYFLVLLVLVYTLFPFYWAFISSLKPANDLFATPIQWWPENPTLENYRSVLTNSNFRNALLNSTIVAVSVMLLALAIGSLAAYALGRIRFRGRSTVLYLVLAMTMFPQIAVLGALYELVSDLNMANKMPTLVVTYMIFTLPFTVWVLTNFFKAMPAELEEAAYVDGATPFQTFAYVFMPLAAPGMVTTGLLAFIAAWNEFLYALTFMVTPDNYTVPVAITKFSGTGGNAREVPWGQIMAASVVVTIPLIVLTLIFQRRILAGLTAGAVKG